MDITPRETFPSGSRIAIDFPPARDGLPSPTIWIDGKCRDDAASIIRRFEAGELTEREAESKIFQLRYGRMRPADARGVRPRT